MKKNSTTQVIVWYAMVGALLFAARNLDHLLTGWLTINAMVVTLPAAYVSIFVKPTFFNAIATGTILGVMSLLTSVIYPSGTTPFFVNPLVSIVPRILVGIVAWGVFVLLRKISSKKIWYVVAVAVACVIATLVNTVTVISMLTVFENLASNIGVDFGAIIDALIAVVGINMALEVVISPFIVPLTTIGVRRSLGYKDFEKANDKKESV